MSYAVANGLVGDDVNLLFELDTSRVWTCRPSSGIGHVKSPDTAAGRG
jgi:hypothetical protein